MQGNSTIATVAEPYAQALMAIAQKEDLAARFGEDVAYLRELLKISDDFGRALASPIVADSQKKSLLQTLAGEQVHPLVGNFLKILVDRKRIAFLDAVCEKYQALLRELTNTVLAEVTTTTELNDDQRQQVVEKVKQLTGAAQVELATTIDSDLIGGAIIKVGSQVIDSSLRGQLRRMALSLGAL